MARLLECDLKEMLRRRGISIPRGVVVRASNNVGEGVAKLALPVVVKAQVPIGRRAGVGGVRIVRRRNAVARAAREMLGREFWGYRADRVLVEEFVAVRSEVYLAFAYDSSAHGPAAMISRFGGSDVEAAAHEVISIPFSPTRGLPEYAIRSHGRQLELSGPALVALAWSAQRLSEFFLEFDLSLLELNPIGLTETGEAWCLDARAEVDDQAASRWKPAVMRRAIASRSPRPPTALERRISHIAKASGRPEAWRFVEFSGDVALMVTTAGGSNVCLDHLLRLGARPMTFLDVTAGVPEEDVYAALRAVLRTQRLRGLLVGSNLTGFNSVETRMRALTRAIRDEGVDTRRTPLAARLAGLGESEARRLAATCPGLKYFGDDATLEQAVEWLVAAIEGATT